MDLRRALLGRSVAVAYGVVVALYLVRHVRFQPLQVPAYLLIVAYDLVELALPVLTPYHPVAFPFFLYLLAVVSAGVARRLGDDGTPSSAAVLGAVALVVAAISFGFGAAVGGPVVSPTDNPTPLAITAATGLVSAALGWWLLGRPRSRGPLAAD